MKIFLNVVAYLGVLMVLIGIAMFFYGVGMFTAKGEFTKLEKNIAEISFTFWIPTVFFGLILTVFGFVIKGSKREKRLPIQKI